MKPEVYTRLMDTILSAVDVCRCEACGKMMYKPDAQHCDQCSRHYCASCTTIDNDGLCHHCRPADQEWDNDPLWERSIWTD